jgi:hypothetical protein
MPEVSGKTRTQERIAQMDVLGMAWLTWLFALGSIRDPFGFLPFP